MNPAVVFHELAEAELNEAASYYAQARRGLGEAFLREAEHAVRSLVASPGAGRLAGEDVRSWSLRRFPYRLFYRTCRDHVRILAVAHQKRRPFYWRERS